MASYSRARSSSPFSHRKSPSPYSSSNSSTSSYTGNRIVPRSGTTSSTSYINSSGCGYGSRSTTPSRSRPDISYYGGNRNRSPVPYGAEELVAVEPIEGEKNGDSISVTIRFRPLSVKEFQRGDEIAWYADGDKIVRSEYGQASAYAFDKVFGEHTSTQDVYDVAAKPVVKAAMEGVNGTVFAYGVTSSGKTFTMHGDQHFPGVIPLAIKDVFRIIQDTPGREFLLRVSYIEIYNEIINDLLDPTGQNLRIREDSQGTYVEGIKEEVVLSPGHALSFIAAGEEHRHVGSNNFNLFSSRSHTIFTLMIESSAHGEEYDGVIFSQLNLIDLAGSESSKTETTGLRRKEGSYINKSLLTLGTVIGKLSEGRSSHVPYRDSKLTRLLQSSLSGHGHVSLICTVTPASSNLEETHNTLKFASRAKRVEIFAARNKIIDEKSLIKKYQREISNLKEELTHLKRGMVDVSHEEILSLKQKLEEGQVKMQSRLEEEEEAKAALMSRIQRLTKLILVSTKSTLPGLTDANCQKTTLPPAEIDHAGVENEGTSIMENQIWDSSVTSSSVSPDALSNLNSTTPSNLDDVISSTREGAALTRGLSSDQMDLIVEQVKMLAEEVALGTSTLKRLVEQSTNGPQNSQEQIQTLEREILEKRRQMRALEQRLLEHGEASIAKSSLVDMQQTIMKLMTQCNEKAFELELKSADNRILQEQLQKKGFESEELQEKIKELEQQLVSLSLDSHSKDTVNDLMRKIESQELYTERLIIEQVQLSEENAELREQNQRLAEDASYAKELASAAAAELKNLAGEITKLSLLNVKLEKDLIASRANTGAKKHSETTRMIQRKSKYTGRNGDFGSMHSDDFESWDLDPDDLKIELMARKQREAALEAALADKESTENEYRRMAEDSKRREAALENDLANMWVLVAKMKKDGAANADLVHDFKPNNLAVDPFVSHISNTVELPPKEENLVVRLKARMQEIKVKEQEFLGHENFNSHQCKICFESPTSAILLPCRHFCMCKSCSVACSECPVCRTTIEDRLFAFAS